MQKLVNSGEAGVHYNGHDGLPQRMATGVCMGHVQEAKCPLNDMSNFSAIHDILPLTL